MTGRQSNGMAAAAGTLADMVVPEPTDRWHPVAMFGRAMTAVERHTYRDSRVAGTVHLVLGCVPAVAAGVGLRRLLGPGAATAVAATVSIGATMLQRLSVDVAVALDEGDLGEARSRVARLVGRDTSELDDSEVSRAAIESVAENTIDAAISPIVWGTIAGAPGVFLHRAVNTLDAMVGYRSPRYQRFGWASARTDDALNWLPARLGALGVAVVRPHRLPAIWRAVHDDAAGHPSPNGGVIEAAFAGALGVRLGGANRYGDTVDDRGTLGDGRPPLGEDIHSAARLARLLTVFAAVSAPLLPAVTRNVHRRLPRPPRRAT